MRLSLALNLLIWQKRVSVESCMQSTSVSVIEQLDYELGNQAGKMSW